MRAIDAMTDDEAGIATWIDDSVHSAISDSMRFSARSEWANANKIGVSDIGGCREYVRRTIIDEEFTDPQENFAAAFVGTAVGDYAEKALQWWADRNHPEWHVRTQLSVTVRLNIYGFELNLPGHPDALMIVTMPDGEVRHVVVDFKSKDKLGATRRSGPEDKQRFQVTLYTKALIDDGTIEEDKAWCALTFIDRSGAEPRPVSFAWKYDPTILQQAEQWMEDVIYAVQHGEETSRDMPRSWCWEVCPRATACRGFDTDAQGVIEQQHLIDAVETHKVATATVKAAKNDLDSAKSVLANVAGVAGADVVRWIEIPPIVDSEGEVKRAGYRRLDIRPVPKDIPRKRQREEQGA